MHLDTRPPCETYIGPLHPTASVPRGGCRCLARGRTLRVGAETAPEELMANSGAELRCLCCGRPVDPIRSATCSKSCASQVRREVAASARQATGGQDDAAATRSRNPGRARRRVIAGDHAGSASPPPPTVGRTCGKLSTRAYIISWKRESGESSTCQPIYDTSPEICRLRLKTPIPIIDLRLFGHMVPMRFRHKIGTGKSQIRPPIVT